MKRPKIKSPFLPSPGKVLIPVKKAGGLKDVSPAAMKSPLGAEVSLRWKDCLSGGSGATAKSGPERRTRTDSAGLTSSGSNPSKDVGRKSLVPASASASGQRGNNQSKVTTAPQVKPRTAQSPMSAKTGESAGSSSSLQRRRKSVGDVMRSSSLTTKKASGSSTPGQPLSVARLASQPRRSLSNSSLKKSSDLSGRAPAPGLVRPSQKTPGASSLTPSLKSSLQSNRRNSVGLQSKVKRDHTPSKSESSSRLKTSRPNLARSGSSSASGGVKKPGRSEVSQHKAVLDENNKKFEVLSLVTTQVIKENDKLEKIIKKNNLQLAGMEAELEMCKVSLFLVPHNSIWNCRSVVDSSLSMSSISVPPASSCLHPYKPFLMELNLSSCVLPAKSYNCR